MFKRIIVITLLIVILNSNNIYSYFNEIKENSVIALDIDSMSVIYNKNGYDTIYPASTTKILTAILVIENLNLNTNITIDDDILEVTPFNSSTMNLKPLETVTVKDLLYGILLPSGNDAAIVLARAVSGSVANFASLMNDKASEIGCLNSNFVNPHGYHDDNQYSTPYDMALIMKYAYENEIFREIIETKEYIVTNLENTTRNLTNTNLLLFDDLVYTLGGKTGFTNEAGNVLVCYASINDKTIVTSVYGGDKDNKFSRFITTKMLVENVFENYNKKQIFNQNIIKVSFIDKNLNEEYLYGINENVYSLADDNMYIIRYNFKDFSIDKYNTIDLTIGNKNWKFKNSYELKLFSLTNYNLSDNIIYKNINMLYIFLILLFVFIIIFSIIKLLLNNHIYT